MSTIQAVHLWVQGHVQGVSYRASTRRKALAYGLQGWVRNLPDGRVEAWIEGDPDAVDALLAWCEQGPAWAKVDQLETSWEEPKHHASFEIRPTPSS